MAEPKLHVVPNDAQDLADLFIDSSAGDAITRIGRYDIPFGKPKDFFRVCPDPAYRRSVHLYIHGAEDQIDKEYYIVAKPMQGRIEKARPTTIVTCIYRDGSVRLWPLVSPADGERDFAAWSSARAAALVAMEKWVRLVWARKAFETRDAQPGYAPEPDYKNLPPFLEIFNLAIGAGQIIRDENHPIYIHQIGGKPQQQQPQLVADDVGDDL